MGAVTITGGTMKDVMHSIFRYENQTVTLSGDLTLTKKSSPLLYLDPGGSGRNVELPAEADSDGLMFVIVNTANAPEDLTVKSDAPATIGVIGQNEIGILVCNGTIWASMITGTAAGLAAADITIADVGTFTSAAEVEAALQEIYQHILSTQAIIELPMMGWIDQGAGTLAALAVFANATTNVPGFTDDSSEGLGIRWNDSSTPNPIISQFVKPMDMDTSKDAVVHILAIRSGTDASDLVTFDVTAFGNDVGAASGADTDFGGVSDAMLDNVVVQELTRTLAAADITSATGAITLRVQPTDGKLDTIDVTVLGVWIEYTKLILTS